MNQIHPDIALVPLLEAIILADFVYHLFTSPNTNPGLPAVLGDFTEEAGTGYAPVTVPGTDFTISGVAGNQGFVIAPDIAFTPGGATTFTNYGYYVTDVTNTVLLAFGMFDGGPVVTTFPSSLTLTPKWGNRSTYAA